jgi:xanthine/uracil/vitamin C permease (AzgA family)
MLPERNPTLSQVVPLAATAPALILVGALMMAPLADMAWDDPEIAIPAFLTMAMIPLTFSIANGLAFGIIFHALLKLLRGRIGRTDWLLSGAFGFVRGALRLAVGGVIQLRCESNLSRRRSYQVISHDSLWTHCL